jgi:hypothetical protein
MVGRVAAQVSAETEKESGWTEKEREQRRRQAVELNLAGLLWGGYHGL